MHICGTFQRLKELHPAIKRLNLLNRVISLAHFANKNVNAIYHFNSMLNIWGTTTTLVWRDSSGLFTIAASRSAVSLLFLPSTTFTKIEI